MSYLVCTMKKMKKENLQGLQKHNQREFENHSNLDIDKDKTDLNYDLVNKEKINFSKEVFDLIEKRKKDKKAVRKDAVLLNSFIISSDRAFFKDMNQEEIRRFFETSKDFFEERYGKENILSANVHLDETTPHMHLEVCPLRDGKLQGKNVFNRVELRNLQEDLPKELIKSGFNIQRGIKGSTQKHVETSYFKAFEESLYKELQVKNRELSSSIAVKEKKLKELDELDFKIETRKAVLNNLSEGNVFLNEKIDYKQCEKGLFKVEMHSWDFEKLQTQVINSKNVLEENNVLKKENEIMKEKCKVTRISQSELTKDFTKWIDKVHGALPLSLKETFERRATEAVVSCSYGNYDRDSSLEMSVMDSKAFNMDVYSECLEERENDSEGPRRAFKNDFDLDL